ncbi:hypothetical protein HDV00_000936 [Rhizophlyctis rosea]|nr:hypothetical protein HDV00_000936 [Rhizophlyctis rosea]
MSYFQDHNLPEPSFSRRSTPRPTNPDISSFMNTDDESQQRWRESTEMHDVESFLAVANLFNSIRDRSGMANQHDQQVVLDNLISQLLEEANASAKGPPPASKAFIRNLPNAQLDHKSGMI